MSACLVGKAVRYNGKALAIDAVIYQQLATRFELVPYCPELSAGLPIPRDPAEIVAGTAGGMC